MNNEIQIEQLAELEKQNQNLNSVIDDVKKGIIIYAIVYGIIAIVFLYLVIKYGLPLLAAYYTKGAM